MRIFTALLVYDDPEIEDVLVTRGTQDDSLPRTIEVPSANAPVGWVDVFELVDGEPLSSFALYEFRHTRASDSTAEESAIVDASMDDRRHG